MCLCHQAVVQVGTGQRAVTLCSWEGNRMSGVALAMRHRLSGLSTYTGSTANVWEMSTSPRPHCGTAPSPFYFFARLQLEAQDFLVIRRSPYGTDGQTDGQARRVMRPYNKLSEQAVL